MWSVSATAASAARRYLASATATRWRTVVASTPRPPVPPPPPLSARRRCFTSEQQQDPRGAPCTSIPTSTGLGLGRGLDGSVCCAETAAATSRVVAFRATSASRGEPIPSPLNAYLTAVSSLPSLSWGQPMQQTQQKVRGPFVNIRTDQQLALEDGDDYDYDECLQMLLLLPTDALASPSQFVPASRWWPLLEYNNGGVTTKTTTDPSPSGSVVGQLNMSSTLKKRRAKMNKHKLRKRRKLLRLKSK